MFVHARADARNSFTTFPNVSGTSGRVPMIIAHIAQRVVDITRVA